MIMTMIMIMTISSIVIEVIGGGFLMKKFYTQKKHKKAQKAHKQTKRASIFYSTKKPHKQTKRDSIFYSHKEIHEQT